MTDIDQREREYFELQDKIRLQRTHISRLLENGLSEMTSRWRC